MMMTKTKTITKTTAAMCTQCGRVRRLRKNREGLCRNCAEVKAAIADVLKAEALVEDAAKLAEKTASAYSFDNYGAERWEACALMLLKRGYSVREAEAILRSKWTRWAADSASSRKGWRYGRTTSADLARFLDTMAKQYDMKREVRELVAGTFGADAN